MLYKHYTVYNMSTLESNAESESLAGTPEIRDSSVISSKCRHSTVAPMYERFTISASFASCTEEKQ